MTASTPTHVADNEPQDPAVAASEEEARKQTNLPSVPGQATEEGGGLATYPPPSPNDQETVVWSPRRQSIASKSSKPRARRWSVADAFGFGAPPERTGSKTSSQGGRKSVGGRRDSRFSIGGFGLRGTDSGLISRFTEDNDMNKTLFELQSLFRDEAEEAQRQKQRELKRFAQKRAGVRTLIGAGGSNLDLGPVGGPRARLHGILTWVWFDFIMGIIITANAVTIGLQVSVKSGDKKQEDVEKLLLILDAVFLVIYTIELCLRLFAYRLHAFANAWIRFDTFLVLSGVVDFCITAFAENASFFDQVMMVRLLRLTRLARIVRFLSQFRVLWALVQGMSHSLTTLVWTFFLIFSLLYTFAILGNDLIEVIDLDESNVNDTGVEEYNHAAEKFNGITKSMLTLAQFLTFDTVGEIYRPLIIEKPWLSLYFVVFVLVCSVALMNLVIAVMVENHMEQSRNDKNAELQREEKRKKKLMPKLRDLFENLDVDGSGDIDWDEIRTADPVTKNYLQEIGKGLDLEELFNMLDYDTCGTLDMNEFCDGLLHAATSQKPLELLRLVNICSEILQTTRHAVDSSHDVSHKLTKGVKFQRRSARTIDCLMRKKKDAIIHHNGSMSSMSPPASPTAPPADVAARADKDGAQETTEATTQGESFGHRSSADIGHRSTAESIAHRSSAENTAHRSMAGSLGHRGSAGDVERRSSAEKAYASSADSNKAVERVSFEVEPPPDKHDSVSSPRSKRNSVGSPRGISKRASATSVSFDVQPSKRNSTDSMTAPSEVPLEAHVKRLGDEIKGVQSRLNGMDSRMATVEQGIGQIMQHVCRGARPGLPGAPSMDLIDDEGWVSATDDPL